MKSKMNDLNSETIVGKTASSEMYHLLDEDHSQSVCGQLNNEGYLGPRVAVTLACSEAENKRLSLCSLCGSHNQFQQDNLPPTE